LEEWYVNPFRKLAPTIEETKAMFDSLNQQAELAKQKPELNKPFIGGDSLSAIGGFIGKGGPAQYIPQKQLSAQEQANQILKEIRDRVSIAQPVVA
jgi:hypothetical protein